MFFFSYVSSFVVLSLEELGAFYLRRRELNELVELHDQLNPEKLRKEV